MQKHLFHTIYFIVTMAFASCGSYNKAKEGTFYYESIVGRKGNLRIIIGGQVVPYDSVTVKYSETNSATILINSKEGKEIYIQGPLILEFYD